MADTVGEPEASGLGDTVKLGVALRTVGVWYGVGVAVLRRWKGLRGSLGLLRPLGLSNQNK